MKYRTVIAIMDDVPDSAGDTLSEDVTIPKPNIVPVYLDWNEPLIGSAAITKKGNKLYATLNISTKLLDPKAAKLLHGVIGGHCQERVEHLISKWSIEGVGLTQRPADHRLPKLKRIK